MTKGIEVLFDEHYENSVLPNLFHNSFNKTFVMIDAANGRGFLEIIGSINSCLVLFNDPFIMLICERKKAEEYAINDRFIIKPTASIEEFISAMINFKHSNRQYFTKYLSSFSYNYPLSPRDLNTLSLLQKGLSVKTISVIFKSSVSSVYYSISRLKKVTGIKSMYHMCSTTKIDELRFLYRELSNNFSQECFAQKPSKNLL